MTRYVKSEVSISGRHRLGVLIACAAFSLGASPARSAPTTRPAAPSADAAAPGTTPATAPANPPATAPAAGAGLSWLTKLQDGIDDAQKNRRPIFVEVGAEWCGWCRLLEKEIADPGVRQRLATWTRVKVDIDKDPDAARALAVGPIPALRVLSPLGRVVASRDGFLKADELSKWLDEHQKQAAASGEMVGDEPADAAGVEALLARVTDADPVVREAATRRLLRRPDLAGVSVVNAFASGNLAQRLATLELLQEWQAPLAGLDPWEPATVTPERLAELKRWAEGRAKQAAPAAPATAPSALAPADLTAARRDLALLLGAAGDAEARAPRERLARFGAGLLPEVYAALKAAASDRDRERLTGLRYRLAASDALTLNWPGGFERLASSATAARHAALEELASRATPADSGLLLELFSDPDPFVRERSLKLLQAMGGQGMTAGLVRLLQDPEPNVRAAVLKQLAEKPLPGMDQEVANFARSEKDPDLVVHAVRVLRDAESRAAFDCLMALLGHESWRVRAEAAEGLGKAAARYKGVQLTQEQKADVYAAMIRLLDDPDGFVVSRAVLVLREGKVPAAMEPMVKAAEHRPELATDVVKSLAGGGLGALPYLRKFCGHQNPGVRAAAIAALVEAAPEACEQEVRGALADPDSKVRTVAATSVLKLLERRRPQPGSKPRGLFGLGRHEWDLEKWLTNFRAGSGQPAWAREAADVLEKIAASDQPDERFAGALALVALGRDEKALPVLRQAIGSQPGERRRAAGALPWLPWDMRQALYKELAAAAGPDDLPALVQAMSVIPNPAAAPLLWDALAAEHASPALASSVYSSLLQLYLGREYYNTEAVAPEKRKVMVEAARAKAEAGTEMQKLAALAALLHASREDAAAAAARILEAPESGEALRADAFRVLLLAGPEGEGEARAVAALKDAATPWERRKAAVRYLALGGDGIRQLRGHIYLNSVGSHFVSHASGEPITVQAPKELTAEMVRPFTGDKEDRESAACAAYLLALAGDRSALDTLIAYWREHGKQDMDWQRLVYRAVAVINDDALVPVLEEVYAGMAERGSYYGRELYWTIRPMKGPNVLKLRKKMRDELGADVLR